MIREARYIAGKDLRYMLRQRETLLWTFIMPVIFFYFIGTITGGMGSAPGQDRIAVLVEGGDGGFLAEQLVHRLEEQDYQVDRVQNGEELAAYLRKVVIPEAFTREVLAGEEAKVRLVGHRSSLGGDYDRIRVSQAVYAVLADLVVTGDAGAEPTAEAFAALNQVPRTLTLTVSPAGKRKVVPNGFAQAIPGNMVMFTLLVLLTSGTVLLVIERQEGLLRRLASAPMSRAGIVLGKWMARLVLALVQIGFGLAAGTFLFKMEWGGSLPAVGILLAAWAAFNATFSILLGSLARSQGQAAGLGVVTSMALGALGGCWWPIEVVPAWMQKLALFLPSGWAMNGMHKLVSFGEPSLSVAPNVAAILAATLVLGILATRTFRYE